MNTVGIDFNVLIVLGRHSTFRFAQFETAEARSGNCQDSIDLAICQATQFPVCSHFNHKQHQQLKIRWINWEMFQTLQLPYFVGIFSVLFAEGRKLGLCCVLRLKNACRPYSVHCTQKLFVVPGTLATLDLLPWESFVVVSVGKGSALWRSVLSRLCGNLAVNRLAWRFLILWANVGTAG